MCAIKTPISSLCRQIADLEHELEQALRVARADEKEYALGLLKSRSDTRAAGILRQYLESRAPLGLDEVAEASRYHHSCGHRLHELPDGTKACDTQGCPRRNQAVVR